MTGARRCSSRPGGVVIDRDAVVRGPLLDEPAQRIGQPDVVERGGAQLPGQEIHVGVELLGELVGLLRELADVRASPGRS